MRALEDRLSAAPGWKPWIYVAMLALAYMISFIDRQILSLLVAPIRQDLQISDVQFSMLHGLAFACFYAVFGFPLGWLVDRTNRIRLVALGIAFWSAATICCGLADNYNQLFGARIAVGVGEAVLSPAAYSLLYDLFDRRRLSRALAIYGSGVTIGAGLAYTVGGAAVSAISRTPVVHVPVFGTMSAWQASFIAVGLPGLLLAATFLIMTEPARKLGRSQGAAADDRVEPIDWPLVLGHNLGFALIILSSAAHNAWVPAYLVRSYGFGPAAAGTILGLTLLVGGTLGLLVVGWISDRLVARGSIAAPLTISIVIAPIAAILCLIAYSSTSAVVSIAALVGVVIISTTPSILGPASLQMILPARQVGRLSALFIFIITIVGQGGGPVAVATVSDKLFRDEQAIGMALGLVSAIALIVGAGVLALVRVRFRAAAALSATAAS